MVQTLYFAVAVVFVTSTRVVAAGSGGLERQTAARRLAFQAPARAATAATTSPTPTAAWMYKRRASREEEKQNWEKRNRGAPDITNIDKTLPEDPNLEQKKAAKKNRKNKDLRLALESAIKITANVVPAANFDEMPADLVEEHVFMVQGRKMTLHVTDFVHYKTVRNVPAAEAANLNILATSMGVEEYRSMEYQDDKAVHDITLAPYDAILKACASDEDFLAKAVAAKTIVVNFLGGDDLSFSQVSTALTSMVQLMGQVVGEKTPLPNFCLNSLSFQDFPHERVALTLVALSETKAGDVGGDDAAQSLAEGEVYFHSGKWWTVAKQDIDHVSWHDLFFGEGAVAP